MNAKLQQHIDALDKYLGELTGPGGRALAAAARRSGARRAHLVLAGGACTALYLVYGRGARLLCNAIGLVYPAYKSLQALESPRADDIIQWLTYWVVFASFSVVEYFADRIVGWVPTYWLLKCAFLIWCYMPGEHNGSLIVYRRVLRPLFLRYRRSE